jgi:hypothetical protein
VGEAQIADADAEAVSAAVKGRRAVLAGKPVGQAQIAPRAASALRRASKREKMFGLGRPRALDRNAKVRIMHWARCLSCRSEKGRAYGVVTAKALAVLEALLWAFHNGRSGVCLPSYELNWRRKRPPARSVQPDWQPKAENWQRLTGERRGRVLHGCPIALPCGGHDRRSCRQRLKGN